MFTKRKKSYVFIKKINANSSQKIRKFYIRFYLNFIFSLLKYANLRKKFQVKTLTYLKTILFKLIIKNYHLKTEKKIKLTSENSIQNSVEKLASFVTTAAFEILFEDKFFVISWSLDIFWTLNSVSVFNLVKWSTTAVPILAPHTLCTVKNLSLLKKLF